MYTDVQVLDLLYRQTAPETILHMLTRSLSGGPDDFLRPKDPYGKPHEYLDIRCQPVDDRRHFLDNAEATLHGYSADEQGLLFDRLAHRRKVWKDLGVSEVNGFLAPVLDAADEYLTVAGGEPVCRADRVLEWRDAYLRLGQDLFVCAYLAEKDRHNATERRRFTWPVILRVENENLYTMLKEGIAENHNHMAGGTQSFQITWCRLMNEPEAIRDPVEFKHFRSSNLFAKMHRADKGQPLGKYEQVELAALIRSILFRALHRDEFTIEIPAGCADKPEENIWPASTTSVENPAGGVDKTGKDIRSASATSVKNPVRRADMPGAEPAAATRDESSSVGPDHICERCGDKAARDESSSGGPDTRKIPFDGRIAFALEYARSFQWINGMVDTLDCLRTQYGAHVPVLDKDNNCFDFVLDYAYESVYARSSIDSDVRILVGERAFIYRCVRACLDPDAFTDFERELFYLYLILQCNFRSEMIQNNDQVGFMNFAKYQDRKDDSWDLSPYYGDAVRLGINNRLNHEHVISMEGRLVPKPDPGINIYKAFRYDIGKRFSDCRGDEGLDRTNFDFNPDLDEDLFKEAPWYYMFHFVKMPDDRKLKMGAFGLPVCRHQNHRKFTKGQAVGLAAALRKSSYLRSRIRGIDAAADEVFCRPEVFACAFRYIDAVQKKWNSGKESLLSDSPMRISKTYHAGEDFMDIAGGLRAMDEAIRFMHLGPHSRIGHGLAMGVDPELHYRTKHFESVLTRQERLDDLIWILFRGKELGVVAENPRESALMARLNAEANELFRYIYGDALIEEKWDGDLRQYWCSMLLRGDDPSVYRSKVYVPVGMSCDEFDDYLIDAQVPGLEAYRKDRQIAGLYYYYHYGVREGLRSQETYSFRVDVDYIRLMRRLQDAMIRFVHDRELIIETNPSSNVLIGTFKDYRYHPIFRLNNRRLTPGSAEADPQLNVCVNTDDLGVFDTTLEFEYALLYAALKERRDVVGGTYSNRDIMDYLEDLRVQGLHAVFQPNK